MPHDCERTRCSYTRVGQQAMQVVHACDRLAVHSDDHIAFSQSCFLSRTAVGNRYHDHSTFAGKIVEADHPPKQGHGLSLDADITTADSSLAQQSSGNKFRGIDSDGETQTLRTHDCRRVHAYNATVGGDQRATGISWVKRRVSLNYVFNQPPGVGTQRTP